MFLKKIIIQGFKSFADKVTINFDQPITAIVGPNGCGKSNITDAIRWVLGEQSAKSLRGSSMSDVIFSGAKNKRTVNLAEVTLIFKNSDKALNSEYETIEVTRRLYKENNESEYLINKVNVRLKDIHNLFMDTGIGKDSLSMISQGNISSFSEARPIDRRGLFEEAAGVSKYKKRKQETLSKLARTQDNLERIYDILHELEIQIKPLKRAKDKALQYRELKNKLEEIEIAVLISEISNLKSEQEDLLKKFEVLQSDHAIFETTVNVHQLANEESNEKLRKLDLDINLLQEDILRIVNEIQTLETRKIEIDEKRKYHLQSADNEIRQKQIKALLNEAKLEYADRTLRLQEIEASIKLANDKLDKIYDQEIKHNQNIEQSKLVIRQLEQRQQVLKTMEKQPFKQRQGTNSIIENKNSLFGVLDVVAMALKPIDNYENAISTALGQALYHVIVSDEESARNCVNFLKKNKNGRATFLPLTVLSKRYVNKEDEIVMNNTIGFLGLASSFVTSKDQYEIVNKALLGNTLVSDNIKNAQYLAKVLNYRYKIVTLDGDVVNRGGSITGGSLRDEFSLLTITKDLEDISKRIETNSEILRKYLNVRSNFENEKSQLEVSIMNYRLNLAKLEPVVDAKRSKYERLKSEYDLIVPKDLQNEEKFSDQLVVQLNKAYSDRDKKNIEIKSLRQLKINLSNDIQRRDNQIKEITSEHKDIFNEINDIKVMLAKIEIHLENNVNRLVSEYKITYENAIKTHNVSDLNSDKEDVLRLREQINKLGNVNMSAPEDYLEVNTRYEFTKKQYDDLILSKENLIDVIDEMDQVMISKFTETFNNINVELKEVFAKLFGGGSATLLLEDPDDILNTGIDIDVKPPGKSIQNIRLFSGGEKALIAISVLFAILKARPVPLCIFDEVEAALDQANVERFSSYLRDFSKETQFIVVTHRPGTMAKADVLYGVTMPNAGVSNMLKVELKEAREIIREENVNELS